MGEICQFKGKTPIIYVFSVNDDVEFPCCVFSRQVSGHKGATYFGNRLDDVPEMLQALQWYAETQPFEASVTMSPEELLLMYKKAGLDDGEPERL